MLIYAAYLLIWALTVSPISTVLIYHFHMDGGFADAELFGGGTDGSTALYDVKGEIARPLLHVAFDSAPLLR